MGDFCERGSTRKMDEWNERNARVCALLCWRNSALTEQLPLWCGRLGKIDRQTDRENFIRDVMVAAVQWKRKTTHVFFSSRRSYLISHTYRQAGG